ncbi:MAG: ABC transporter substrate-binding protein [Desulfobacca sp.]|uniref:ABC transporter substrate-binding protein n=1 Tax=Desulfobacca sp. TaxID=2067990 RepID=UPI00404A182E
MQLAIILLLLVMAAPVMAAEPSQEQRPWFTFTDALGQQVTVRLPVRRVVTNNGQVAEISCALGAAAALVGISDHTLQQNTELLTPLKDKTAIGPAANPSIEKIVDLEPELVIVYDIWLSPDQLEGKLAPLGIPVARLNCYRIDTIRSEIAILGKLLGKEAEAAAYLQDFDAVLALTTVRLQGLARPVRVYAEGYSEHTTSSRRAPNHELFALAGMENIAADLPVPSPRVTPEWVVTANPAVIIKAATASYIKMGFGIGNLAAIQKFHAALCRRPSWEQIEAVQKGRVYLMASEINSGPRLPIGLLYKAKWCHPERFRDIDPEQVHRDWLRRWHQQELRGIYVYP